MRRSFPRSRLSGTELRQRERGDTLGPVVLAYEKVGWRAGLGASRLAQAASVRKAVLQRLRRLS